jgi:hypothetical protein
MAGFLAMGISFASEPESAVDVAAKSEATRAQTWASLAWCEAGKCWLAAWREGYLNEPEKGTDIWCARISGDGKPLDPAGIRLAGGKGLKDRPRIASDGKSFFVVWEDLRDGIAVGGKGWDVYGADGKVAGIATAIAGGNGNQCRPDVAFAGGHYLVAWHAFGGNYSVPCVRVAPDGKVLDATPNLLFRGGKTTMEIAAVGSILTSNGADVLAACRLVGTGLEGTIVRATGVR